VAAIPPIRVEIAPLPVLREMQVYLTVMAFITGKKLTKLCDGPEHHKV